MHGLSRMVGMNLARAGAVSTYPPRSSTGFVGSFFVGAADGMTTDNHLAKCSLKKNPCSMDKPQDNEHGWIVPSFVGQAERGTHEYYYAPKEQHTAKELVAEGRRRWESALPCTE